MNISIILAHPDRTSFNHAIANSAGNHLQMKGHDVTFHDLYDKGEGIPVGLLNVKTASLVFVASRPFTEKCSG